MVVIMYRVICLIIFSVLSSVMISQNTLRYIWPVDSNLNVTGNYGELRPNHFHAGIDFSTAGAINLPVYSIEEGYISRIRISPYGYGKCVYITHPDGKVSVYAHLNAFSLKVANLAKEYQYATQSSEFDFMLKPRTAYVRRNEIIGRSGNTGSSTGPHLHFEIRDELSEVPLNPLNFYRLNDKQAPELNAIGFYTLADTSAPAFLFSKRVKAGSSNDLTLENDYITLPGSIIGLAFSGFDRCKINGSMNNIYSVKLFENDNLIYEHYLDSIGFHESRYINEFIDREGKNKFQKCFMPTVYPKGLYGKCVRKGRLLLNDTAYSKIKLVFMDESGNKSSLQFYLKAKQINGFKYHKPEGDVFVNCAKDVRLKKNGISLFIPRNSLFYSQGFFVENSLATKGKLQIAPSVNLCGAVRIGFKVPAAFEPKRQQLILKGNSLYFPTVRKDSVFFDVKEFGNFSLMMDTVPPEIKLIYSDRKIKDAWQMDAFSFFVRDKLSGIGKYNLWLNNSWVPVEYDVKTDLLTYYFDEETPMGILNFKLEVFDKSGNSSFLEYVLKK